MSFVMIPVGWEIQFINKLSHIFNFYDFYFMLFFKEQRIDDWHYR